MTTSRHTRWWRGSAALVSGLTTVALTAQANEANAAAGVTATIKKGVLAVTGTTSADAISLRLRAGDPSELEIDRLTVNGLDGIDSVTATSAAAALILLNFLP
jgi:hypothetical protein